MATCNLFEEDEVYVYKPGKGYSFGLVIENSEFLSSEEDEVEPPEDRLHKGTVRVAWYPIGKETVVPEDKVQLLDRSLMPGDVVRRLIPGEESQCGFVMDLDVLCHLHILRTNKYIYNVNSKDLIPLQKFESGQEVMLDSWLGRVECVNVHIVLVFADGAKCQVDESDIYPFDDVSEKRSRHGEFSVCFHYPGQELKGPMDCLSDAKWLHSTPRYCHKVANRKGKCNIVHVTIEKIINKNVDVHWLFRGYEKGDSTNETVNPPPTVIEGDNVDRLKVLNWFSHCHIQIGDRMTYRIKNDDLISLVEPGKAYDPNTAIMKDAPIRLPVELPNKNQEETTVAETDDGDDADFEDVDEDNSDTDEKQGACGGRCLSGGHGGRKRSRGLKGHRHKPGRPSHNSKSGKKKCPKEMRSVRSDEVVEIDTEFTTSWATVMWQDGTIERDIPSVKLFPVHHLDELEFFPGDFVLPTVELSQPVDYGVVVKADHAERTCLVHWYKAYDVRKETIPTLVENNAEMSVYDIKDHADYKFRPGQSVVRVGGFESLPEDSDRTRQAVGQIFELDPNGHLVVKWADGSISQCYPQEVFIVSDEADDVSDNNSLDNWTSESDYETDGSGETWETESEQEIIGEDGATKGDKDDSGYDQEALCEHKQELDSLLSRAETALARLQRLLNNFDISSVAIPECFHDIIRIYRSCHDLDKILLSSFFADPELQSLISQAKKELRRDRANKISKHLSQLFEAWSNSLPAENAENVGTVAFGGKTIRIGALRKGAGVELSFEIPTGNEDSQDNSMSSHIAEALGNAEPAETDDKLECSAISGSLEPAASNVTDFETRGLKKETSEPAISKICKSSEPSTRRPSDPSSEISAASGARNKKKTTDVNLVGENCVSKAAKRAKSDSCDDSGHEAKKSRDETSTPHHVAQELCFKICQNLQKQILKIHEEVNKRTKRLMNAASKSDKGSGFFVDKSTNTPNESADQPVKSQQTQVDPSLSEERSATADLESSQVDETSADVGDYQNESTSSQIHSENVESGPDSIKKDEEDRNNITSENNSESGVGDHAGTPAGEKLKNDAKVTCAVSPSNSSASQVEEEEVSASLEDIKAAQTPCKGFDMCGEAQPFHKYISQQSQPSNPRAFRTAVKKELKLFQSSLPDGIFVKGFEDRLDLYSVMILAPEGTPYEDALFLFDIMLPNDYPNSPPLCYYYSFCSDRLNPNLYEDGKVCVSLLGTWSGKGTEVWTSKSNLLQVLLSIQGLILVPEPYYNEAGYERQRGTQVGQENSRIYNEMAILKTVQSLTKMCQSLPILFKQEIYQYLKSQGPSMIGRLRNWMKINEKRRTEALLQLNNSTKNSEHQEQQSCTPSGLQQVAIKSSTLLDVAQHSTSQMAANKLLDLASTHTHHPQSEENMPSEDGKNDGPSYAIGNDTVIKGSSTSPEALVVGDDSNICTSGSHQFSKSIQAVNALHINSAEPVKQLCKTGERDNIVHRKQGNISGINLLGGDIPSPCSSGLSTSFLSTENCRQADSNTITICKTPAINQETNIPVATNTNVPDKGNGIENTNDDESQGRSFKQPEFPLFPMSKGFCLTLRKFLNLYENALQQLQDPAIFS